MIIDLHKALEMIAANPEVKKAVAGLRDKGVAEALVTLGLSSRSSVFGASIVAFTAGAVVGGATAMLLTPRTGEAFRKDVQEFISSLRDRAEQTANRATGESRKMSTTENNSSRIHTA